MTVVLGVGGRPGACPDALAALVDSLLHDHGMSATDVELVATLDRRAGEPGILALAGRLGVRVVTLDAAALAAQPVLSPSEVVRRHTGTQAVAEAAVLACGGALVEPRRAGASWTVALGLLRHGAPS